MLREPLPGVAFNPPGLRNAIDADTCAYCNSSRPMRSGEVPPVNPEQSGLFILTARTFEDAVIHTERHVFVLVSADWCPACVQTKPAWLALAALFVDNPEITIALLDCDANEVDRRYFPEPGIPSMKLFRAPYKTCAAPPVPFDCFLICADPHIHVDLSLSLSPQLSDHLRG